MSWWGDRRRRQPHILDADKAAEIKARLDANRKARESVEVTPGEHFGSVIANLCKQHEARIADLLAKATRDALAAQATAAEAQRKAEDATRAVDSLTDAMHKRCLELELQVNALLQHFERQQKMPLEFATVPAQGERVEVRRKA